MHNALNLDSNISILKTLVEINTGTYNFTGIVKCSDYIKTLFKNLNCTTTDHFCNIDPSKLIAISFKKNTTAKQNCLLSIHMDTVFNETSSFKTFNLSSKTTATGPGVIDAKGGIVVAFNVLNWLESSEFSNKLGWTFIISTDEEIGSPDSKTLLKELSQNKDFALVFEPALENGNIVSTRPASANLRLISHGKSAHSGRHFAKGINAITALTSFIESLKLTYYKKNEYIINIGTITGGTRENIVPDYAHADFNIRFNDDSKLTDFCNNLQTQITTFNSTNKAQLNLDIQSIRPSKPISKKATILYDLLNQAIDNCSINIKIEPSFGVCDGNFIAAENVPVIDTLGPVGTGMHTEKETIYLNSIQERSKLTCELIKLYLTQ